MFLGLDNVDRVRSIGPTKDSNFLNDHRFVENMTDKLAYHDENKLELANHLMDVVNET